MMTPSSHGFNTHIISVYQMRGKCRRELSAVAMLPIGEKGEARQGRLAAQVLLQAPGTEQASHGATLPLPGGRSACWAWKPARKCHQTKQKYFLSNSTTHKSPLPPSGNNMDLKTSVSSSNDKTVYLGKQQKKNRESFCLKHESLQQRCGCY